MIPTPEDTRPSEDDVKMASQQFTFMQQLMESNEANLKRIERMLEQQEKQLQRLNAKELAIANLKRALEYEKDKNAQLQTQLNRLSEARNGLKADLKEEHMQESEAVSRCAPDPEPSTALSIPAIESGTRYEHHTLKKRKLETGNPLEDLCSTIAEYFSHYIFAPLMQQANGDLAFGDLDELSPAVLKSLQHSLDKFQERRERLNYIGCPDTPKPGKSPASCGFLWLTGCTSSRAWTRHSAGRYTCKTCFNARRACFRWVDGQWVVLPLPPEVRNGRAIYTDAAYYIYERTDVTTHSFPAVWEQSAKDVKKQQQRRLAQTDDPEDWEVYEAP